MLAILLTADLMTASQAQGAAQRAGCKLATAANVNELLRKVVEDSATLVVLDLSTSGLDCSAVVQSLRSLDSSLRILAFGPHVHAGRLEAARAAGCDFVLSRGEFHARCEDLFGEMCRGSL